MNEYTYQTHLYLVRYAGVDYPVEATSLTTAVEMLDFEQVVLVNDQALIRWDGSL